MEAYENDDKGTVKKHSEGLETDVTEYDRRSETIMGSRQAK
jgi:hypothetical protein